MLKLLSHFFLFSCLGVHCDTSYIVMYCRKILKKYYMIFRWHLGRRHIINMRNNGVVFNKQSLADDLVINDQLLLACCLDATKAAARSPSMFTGSINPLNSRYYHQLFFFIFFFGLAF